MKKLAYLNRFIENEFYTIGKLQVYNISGLLLFECLTLELPYNENKRNISSIPLGTYIMKLSNSPKFGNVYKLENVQNRSEILIHKGNYSTDTQGCIIVGSALVLEANFEKGMLINSTTAFNNLMKLNIKSMTIKITAS